MLFLLIACAAAVYLWHHAPALLMLLVAGGVLWYVVIPLGIIVFCGIGLVLVWAFNGLSWLANALPACWLFDGPRPKAAPPVVLMPEVIDLRVDRARLALRACARR